MYPDVDRTLVTADMMHRGLIVNDIVYEPLQTKLLREAKKAGAKTVDGLGMLVHQGAMAFEIWTGKTSTSKSYGGDGQKGVVEERLSHESRNHRHWCHGQMVRELRRKKSR